MEKLLELLEERITTVEQIVANLFNGYVELATMTESLLTQMLKPLDEEAAAAFTAEVHKHRDEMLKMVRDVASGMVADAGTNASPVEPVAE